MIRKMKDDIEKEESDSVQCKLCLVNRCTKVVTGGRRFRFSAAVVAGDMKTKVGWGFAKANSVSDAIKRAEKRAVESMIDTPKTDGTISCLSKGTGDSVTVLLKPAREGTGIVGGSIPALILEMGGYKNIVSKNIRGGSRMNQIIAVFEALAQAKNAVALNEFRKKIID